MSSVSLNSQSDRVHQFPQLTINDPTSCSIDPTLFMNAGITHSFGRSDPSPSTPPAGSPDEVVNIRGGDGEANDRDDELDDEATDDLDEDLDGSCVSTCDRS